MEKTQPVNKPAEGSDNSGKTALLRIIHFNDVYDIQPTGKNGEGGAYYFKALLDKKRNDKTLTLFSGDAFSPSILTTLFHGWHMVQCLQHFKIDAACFGNHEFDFEIEHTESLARSCQFPWLLGNLIDRRTQQPLGGGGENIVLTKNGLRIGVFGVAEEEWLTLLKEDYQDQLDYIDFVNFSKYQCSTLRKEYKCDLVIALSHMRIPNNQKLAREVGDLDFILAGHDHVVFTDVVNGVRILTSGSNFEHLSVIDIYPKNEKHSFKCRNFTYQLETMKVPVTEDYDKDLKRFVDEKIHDYNKDNERIVAYTDVPLETRFSHIRTGETNYGNLCADVARAYYNCDVMALNSGGIRIDKLIPPGPLKFSLINNMIDDWVIVKAVPGALIYEVLENSCSKYPSYDGRFLMVSGIVYSFDAAQPPGKRVIRESVKINGYPVDQKRIYKVGLRDYSAKGGDGYTCLKDCPYVVNPETGVTMIFLLTRFYKPFLAPPPSMGLDSAQLGLTTVPSLNKRKSSKTDRMSKFIVGTKEIDDEYYVEISPIVDGRIKIVNGVQIPQ